MPTNYEALFIFAGSVKEEALDNVIADSTAEIVKLGGTIEQIDKLGRKTFARPMKKAEHGTYVKVRFAIEGDQVGKIRQRFKHNDDCLRLQIVGRNARIEAAKAADDARRALFKATAEAAAAKAAAQTAPQAADEPVA